MSEDGVAAENRVETALINDLDPEAISAVAARSRKNSNCSDCQWSSGKKSSAPNPPNGSTSRSSIHSRHSSSQSSALDQDCANLKHNLSLSWWKYDKRKRRHCFMWLGFALFLVIVIVAMVVFISSLTGGSEPYTILDTSNDEEVSYNVNVDKVTLKPLDRLRSSIGGLMLMIGGEGQNGQEVEVISGKGKEVVRVNVDYLSNRSIQHDIFEKGTCNLPYGYPQRLPVYLSGHMAGVYEDHKIIVCGGLEKTLSFKENELSRRCWSFDSMTNVWSQLKTRMLWPVAFASSIVTSDKSKFYIMGGNDEGTVLSTTQVMSLDDMKWSLGPSLHSPLWGHCSVEVGGRIVVIGGWNKTPSQTGNSRTLDSARILKSAHVLRGTNWIPLKQLRHGRSTHGCAVTNYKTSGHAIVVAGGMGLDQHILDTVEILRIDKRDSITEVQWAQLPKMNNARGWYPAVGRLNNRLLIAGGKTGIPPDQFSFEVWSQQEKQWKLYDDSTSKQSKFKSANVLLHGLLSRYGTIFQNCFIRRS